MIPTFLLGINHHLLYPESMVDHAAHENTLPAVLAYPDFQVVDLFVDGTGDQRTREERMICDSDKHIVYNMPLLACLSGCNPNALDRRTVKKTRDAALPHLDSAANVNALKMVIASGPNPPPEKRESAWQGWLEYLAWIGGEAEARGLRLVIEPFDQSIGKNLLIGPTTEAVRAVQAMRERGIHSVGLMVDMGHLPIMGESFAHALQISAPYLWHVHLGNAVISNPDHPWFGDCHPPLGMADGEHGRAHIADFLRLLRSIGYFDTQQATVTMEMRPYAGVSPRHSVERWLAMMAEAWAID